MNISQLKFFVTVAETLHFGKAANLLYVSQSTLSYNIAELEKELGVSLFLRNNRKVLLSSAGFEILPLAKQILENFDTINSISKKGDSNNIPLENLKIAFDYSFANFYPPIISDAIYDFRNAHPGINLDIKIRPFDDLLKSVENMDADLGVAILKNSEHIGNHLNILPICTDELMLIHNLPYYDGASVKDILEHNTIYLVERDLRWSEFIINIIDSITTKRKIEFVDSFNDIVTYVRFGGGITIMMKSDIINNGSKTDLKNISINRKSCTTVISVIWAKCNYNYAITELLSHISSDAWSIEPSN